MGYMSVESSPGDQYVYTGGSRGIVRIWDTKSRREVSHSEGINLEEKETGGILDIMYSLSVFSNQKL